MSEKVFPSKEIALPPDVAEKYIKYCEITKMKQTEPLRGLILESIPNLSNMKDLDKIIIKTRARSKKDTYTKFYVRLPKDKVEELNTFCSFFKLNWRRCHFLYFLIEEKLLKKIEDVLNE